VTATNLESNPWWQVDLGTSTVMTSVVIWNRTDCCGSRLNDYWLFVSDTPFLPSDTPATLQSRALTFASHQTAAPNPSTTIPTIVHPCPPGALCPDILFKGRYMRIQLSSPNYLSLAEVQVFGTAVGGPSKVASQSSTLPGTPSASVAIDGNPTATSTMDR
jgi:alpha-L-fucosidase